MGEVYRAEDTRLNRQVALKLLPPEFAANPERKQRFEQEAKAIAALNHPNIVSVFDVGENYFITELVDGESLKKANLTLRGCLDVAAQIADGLSAAHSAGVKHRDIKPDNILLTRDGRVKILDFGLAKMDPRPAPDEATLTLLANTDPGMVMGTIGYMSPEQVRGQPADHRSDIFSFGAVLYELVTRKKAFAKASAAETMAAIANEDPPEMDGSVPGGLRQIVSHCLEKSPDKRFQSARDLAFALRSLSGSGVSAATPVPAAMTRRSMAGWIAAGAAALTGTAGYFAGTRGTSSAPEIKYRRLTFRRGYISSARFAREARSIVFAANWEGGGIELHAARTDTTESSTLGIRGAHIESISRQSELAILIRDDISANTTPGVVARAPLLGGAQREMAKDILTAEWTRDGQDLIVARRTGGKNRIEWPVGKPIYETDNRLSAIRVSPDGKQLALAERPDGMTTHWSLSVLNQSGEKKPIPHQWPLEGIFFDWASPDELWLEMGTYAGTELYSVRLDGTISILAHTLAPFRLMDVSEEGNALIARQIWRVGIAGITAGQTTEQDHSWLDASEVDDISPDGKTLLITEYGEGGDVSKWSVYVRKTDGSPAIRLSEGQACALSPDGTRALTLRRSTPPQLVLVPLGAGESVALKNTGYKDFSFANWTPDGKSIIFDADHKTEGWRIWLLDLVTGKSRSLTPRGVKFELGEHTVSPDGKMVGALVEGMIWLYPITEGQPIQVKSTLPVDRLIRYSADGRHLFARRWNIDKAEVLRIEVATGRAEIWKTIRPTDPAGITSVYCIQITRDEKSYFYNYTRILSDLYLMEGLRKS